MGFDPKLSSPILTLMTTSLTRAHLCHHSHLRSRATTCHRRELLPAKKRVQQVYQLTASTLTMTAPPLAPLLPTPLPQILMKSPLAMVQRFLLMTAMATAA